MSICEMFLDDKTPQPSSSDVAASSSSPSSSPTDETVAFPVDELQRLDELLNKPRWIVPVLAKQELEVLLDASIDLCRQGNDTKSEHCQRFFRDGLMLSFTKLLTDEAVNTWKLEIFVILRFKHS